MKKILLSVGNDVEKANRYRVTAYKLSDLIDVYKSRHDLTSPMKKRESRNSTPGWIVPKSAIENVERVIEPFYTDSTLPNRSLLHSSVIQHLKSLYGDGVEENPSSNMSDYPGYLRCDLFVSSPQESQYHILRDELSSRTGNFFYPDSFMRKLMGTDAKCFDHNSFVRLTVKQGKPMMNRRFRNSLVKPMSPTDETRAFYMACLACNGVEVKKTSLFDRLYSSALNEYISTGSMENINEIIGGYEAVDVKDGVYTLIQKWQTGAFAVTPLPYYELHRHLEHSEATAEDSLVNKYLTGEY